MMLGTGSITNQMDLASKRCRVFVGNLNTVKMSKAQLENIFSKYGKISGISMHKGYAFVQYFNETTARISVTGEDQQLYYGMRLDVNIASEPKGQKRGRMQANSGMMMNRNSTQPLKMGGGSLLDAAPMSQPAKRLRLDNSGRLTNIPGNMASIGGKIATPQRKGNTNLVALTKPQLQAQATNVTTTTVVQNRNVKDILICGSCKVIFHQMEQLLNHKQTVCRLRYTCRCKEGGEPVTLDCAVCGSSLPSSWELILHCQEEHGMAIHGTGDNQGADKSTASDTSVKADSVKEEEPDEATSQTEDQQAEDDNNESEDNANGTNAAGRPGRSKRDRAEELDEEEDDGLPVPDNE